MAFGDAAPTGLSLTALGRAAAEASQSLPDRVPISVQPVKKLSSLIMDFLPNLLVKFHVTSMETQSRFTDLHTWFAARRSKKVDVISRFTWTMTYQVPSNK